MMEQFLIISVFFKNLFYWFSVSIETNRRFSTPFSNQFFSFFSIFNHNKFSFRARYFSIVHGIVKSSRFLVQKKKSLKKTNHSSFFPLTNYILHTNTHRENIKSMITYLHKNRNKNAMLSKLCDLIYL